MSDGILPSGTPPAPPTARAEPPAVIAKAPVTQSPPQLTPTQDGTAQRIEGRVVAERPPVDNQVRVQTPQGDIVIRSERPITPDTQVIVDLQRQKAALVATLRITARMAEAQAQPAQTPPPSTSPSQPAPAPPVLPGDRLTALILAGTVSPPAAPPPATAAAPAAQIQIAVQQMIQAGQTAKMPLPASLLTAFAASADPDAFLAALPADQRQILQSTLPAPAPAAAMTAGADDAAAFDAGLLTLFRAMTTASLTQQALKSAPAMPLPGDGGPAAPPVPALLQALLPLLQNVQQAPGTAAPASAPLFPQMPAGAELRIVTIQLPGTTASATPTASPPTPPLLQGTVIGQTSNGMAVIHTPKADFVLTMPARLPVGSTITFEAVPLTTTDLTARLTATGAGGALSFDPLGFSPLSSKTWPALSEALQILAQNAPNLSQTLQNTLPAPGPRMVPATLFFMAALKMGLVENWLGSQTLQGLREQGQRGIGDRLGSDFAQIARQSGDPLPGDWRGISLPLLHDAQLSQLQLFVRKQHDDEDKDGADSGKTTRFIVNLSLSQLGDMQLDGLMRQQHSPGQPAQKTLDMVIRTATRLSMALMQDLQDAYAKGLAETGLKGSMQFQAQKAGWVTITPHAGDGQLA